MNTKHSISLRFFWAFLAGFFVLPLFAQDDLYYDPATDRPAPAVVQEDYSTTGPDQVTRRHRDPDEYYGEDDDEYAYEYSSRIRRFHRPVRVVEYYDPFFTDLWFYDPYYLPGASIYTYGFNDYWSWRRWNRWNAGWGWNAGWNSWGWNSWGWNRPGWNSWGWNSPWNTPFVVNNYYYDPYWTWNGWNPYCPNVVNNYYYNNNGNYWNNNNNGNNNGYTPRTYTGTRRHGSSVNPGYARIADDGGRGRLSPDTKGTPVIEKSTRGRVVTDREPDAQSSRTATPGTVNGRRPMNPDAGRTNGVEDRRPNAPADATPGRTRIPEGRPARDNDAPAGRRPNDDRSSSEPRTIRPDDGNRPSRTARPDGDGRTPDVRSDRPAEPARDVRPARPSYEPRSSQPSNDRGNDARPARPSYEPRSSQPSNDRGNDARPARPSYEPRSSQPSDAGPREARPSRSGGDNSGGGSRGSSGNSGGGRSSSGGGSRGRQ
jgi:uncharacterized membrane protein YgcG